MYDIFKWTIGLCVFFAALDYFHTDSHKVENQTGKPLEKPFIIVDASTKFLFTDFTKYTFQDKNGNIKQFDDSTGKYSIGDTLK